MGKRGPKPTPTQLLSMRGSWRAKVREGEPQAESGIPACPEWLDDDGRAIWAAAAQMLNQMGVLAKVDGNLLARYCDGLAQWQRAAKWIRDKGLVYTIKDIKGDAKFIQQWPQVGIYHKLNQQLLRMEQEFGMTPSARAGLATTPHADTNRHGKSRFFNAG